MPDSPTPVLLYTIGKVAAEVKKMEKGKELDRERENLQKLIDHEVC